MTPSQTAVRALLDSPAMLEHIAQELAFTVCLTQDVPTITDALREALAAQLPKPQEDEE